MFFRKSELGLRGHKLKLVKPKANIFSAVKLWIKETNNQKD